MANEWNLRQLLDSLKLTQPVQMRFHEEKMISLLDDTQTLEGLLEFRPPDYVNKEITKPFSERYEIQGEQLRISRGKREIRRLNTQKYPLIAAFAAAFRAPLTGDLHTLETHFKTALEGNPNQWTLKLLPRSRELSKKIMHITLHGGRGHIKSIETLEAGGDHSLMTISD